MIYVLSNNRIDTMRWARSQGLSLPSVKHVQSAKILPGVLNPKRTRIVVLPSYAKRLDKFAINARLRMITRRAKIALEQWTQDEDGTYVAPAAAVEAPQFPLDQLLHMAVLENAEFDLPELEEEAPELVTDEVTVIPKAEDFLTVVGKHLEGQPGSDAEKAIFIGNLSAGLPAGDSETSASYAEGEDAKASVAKTTLPADPAEKATEPVDFRRQIAAEPVIVNPETIAKLAEPEEKPRRVRRTNVQIAYDKALVDWESNGGSVEAVKAARAELKDGDERLESDPTEPDDLDF